MAGSARRAVARLCSASPDLARIVGSQAMTRGEALKRLWAYIKARNLQNPEDRRIIVSDSLLLPILRAEQISMFEMTKRVSSHLQEAP